MRLRAPLWLPPPLLGLAAVYAALLPIAPGSGAATPDLLYCLVFAWIVRAPRGAPVLVVLALGLFADLMLSRPPGLGALGLLAVSELVRGARGAPRDWAFLREWLFAALAFALMIGAMTLLLALSLAAPPSLGALLWHVVATIVAYPFVAGLVGWLLGGRRGPTPGRGGRPA